MLKREEWSLTPTGFEGNCWKYRSERTVEHDGIMYVTPQYSGYKSCSGGHGTRVCHNHPSNLYYNGEDVTSIYRAIPVKKGDKFTYIQRRSGCYYHNSDRKKITLMFHRL